jgi:FlaA1/EpsC-like NDP-sugar epimerase
VTFQKRVVILATLDTFIVIFSVMWVYLLRFEYSVPVEQQNLMPFVVLSHVFLYLFFFNRFKIYHRVLEFASIGEGIKVFQAATLAELSFILLNKLTEIFILENAVPRSAFTAWAFIIIGVGGTRFAWRIIRDVYLEKKDDEEQRRVLIIGAGKAGVLISKELSQSREHRYQPIGFIDDDPRRHKLSLMGIPVLGGREKIQTAVQHYSIDDIVIAMPSASRAELVKMVEICKKTKASIKILPRVEDLINGKVSVNMIRDVQVEDLLGREKIDMDMKEVSSYLQREMVLVTGAGGSIGSELCRQILPFIPKQLILLGHGENSIYQVERELKKSFPDAVLVPIIADIQDRRRMEEVFKRFRPSVVFHAAAHKHVPLMEQNPIEAIKNNVFGTKNVAECARLSGARHFVMISTDKAVNPTSVMGATKRLAEMLVQGLNKHCTTKFVAVRFGNVLGSRGSVIPIFKEQIKQGGPLTVTHPDMVRYFMTIPEAVQLTIQAGASAKGGEIFVLDMGEPVKIVEMARDLIRLSGFEPDVDIKIVFTGVRPGEKLYEELLTFGEKTQATKHERIFIAQPVEHDCDEVKAKLSVLEFMLTECNEEENIKEIKNILLQMIPETILKNDDKGGNSRKYLER